MLRRQYFHLAPMLLEHARFELCPEGREQRVTGLGHAPAQDDGANAGRFMQTLKEYMEDPMMILAG